MRAISLTLALAVGAQAALADDAALLLGVDRYGALNRVPGATAITDPADDLAAVGFAVTALENGAAADMTDRLSAFLAEAEDADRLVVGLSGAFATDGRRTWLLPVDMRDPGLFRMDGAVSLDSLFRVLTGAAGQAVLILGSDRAGNADYGPHLRPGLGQIDPPQGVTVISGPVDDAADLIAALAAPGADLIALVEASNRLQIEGFTPMSLVLVPADVTPAEPVATTEPSDTEIAAEDALWEGAQALDTADAYRNYLARYPQGRYAEQATALILEISTEPNRADRLTEEGLNLDRDARRNIQRNLTLLDFDPRGIDGIFGPGTRSAITNWQQQNGFSQTSYLTSEQITRLDAQAARRAAELEAEAERARAEKERQDRAFWAETGAQGDEPGYRAYLDRFPDGIFAAEATQSLAAIEEAKRQQAAAADKTAWDRATAANTVDGYQAYLASFPQGAFTAEANARIAALQAPEPSNDAAIAAETALGLDGITLRLIEARLAQLGLEPGEVDGGLDQDSRRAIRNFQDDRDLAVTGYLNEETIVRLLADGFRAITGD